MQLETPSPLRCRIFASSENNAIRKKSAEHLGIDPMSLQREGPEAAVCPDRRKLDPVDPNIVAKVNMKEATETAQRYGDRHPDAAWAKNLVAYYASGFPKLPPTAEAANSRALRGPAADTAAALKTATILRKVETRRSERTYASLFQVPKNEEVDRAIVNCKQINKCYERPPPLSLADIGTLLGLIKFFEDAILATADIRHFFWQLVTPPNDRPRFSVHVDYGDNRPSERLACVALPMGWSWSPWVAQAVAGLVVARAGEKLRANFGDDVEAIGATGISDESAPPFWYIRKAGRVVAIVIIWYDNFLVAAAAKSPETGNIDWNGRVRDALNRAMASFKIAWKKDKKTGEVWAVARNEAEYIGIRFSRTPDGVFTWKHIDANIKAWSAAGIARSMPLNEVAQVLGFITWDTHVRLGRRLPLLLRQLMSRVGSLYHHLHELGISKRLRDAEEFALADGEFTALEAIFASLLENAPMLAPDDAVAGIRLLASDATPTCAAGVILDVEPPTEARYTRAVAPFAARSAHINCVETLAAVETVRLAMQRDDRRRILFAIAVDNTTAVAWFNGKAALDEAVQDHLEALDRDLEERECHAWAWWEPTATQPADETSKSKPLVAAKVHTCRERLSTNAHLDLCALSLMPFRATRQSHIPAQRR